MERIGLRLSSLLSYTLLVGMALALAACASTRGAEDGRFPAAVEGPTEPLFDGESLDGWNGDPRFWRVEDGTLVGETTADDPLAENTFLIWEGDPVRDFHLAFEFRMPSAAGNSGVQYRSRPLHGWTVGGYQADMDAENRYTGMLYEEGGRGILARRGQEAVVDANGRVAVADTVGDPDELAAQIDLSDWNTYEITAVGHRIVHRINGRVTAALTDEDTEGRSEAGIIALQLHTGPPMRVEYRDIVLTRSAPDAP